MPPFAVLYAVRQVLAAFILDTQINLVSYTDPQLKDGIITAAYTIAGECLFVCLAGHHIVI